MKLGGQTIRPTLQAAAVSMLVLAGCHPVLQPPMVPQPPHRPPDAVPSDTSRTPPPSHSPAAESQPETKADGKPDWEAWLQPPPPDQPQPKLVCERPKYDAEPVWYGQSVTFSWEIANAGEAPLRVRLLP